MSLILAIDQSTSATKAVLFDARGKVLDKASKSHRQIYPQPGWVEHDAEEIWKNVLAVIREIAKRNRRKLSQLAGLSLSNQRETVVVFDRSFALVGDAQARELGKFGAITSNNFADDGQNIFPDFFRVVFHPAGLRINLAMRLGRLVQNFYVGFRVLMETETKSP